MQARYSICIQARNIFIGTHCVTILQQRMECDHIPLQLHRPYIPRSPKLMLPIFLWVLQILVSLCSQ